MEELYEKLAYLETRELWLLMQQIGVMYCNIEDEEVEDLQTGEKKLVPRFIPRTDYDNMKSDICMKYISGNRATRRSIDKYVDKIARKRMSSAAGVEVKDQ